MKHDPIIIDPLSELEQAKADQQNRQVVRVTTSFWRDSRGIHMRRSLVTMKRKSTGHLWLDEDVDNVGADEVWNRITNILECKEGELYTIQPCNEKRDWESGMIEDYDYVLVPFNGGAK